MKHIALILGLTLPVTLLSCAKAEAQTAKQNVEFDSFDSLEEKIAALEAQLGTDLRYEKVDTSKSSNGYGEKWYEYDSYGRKIHYKDSNGNEEWTEYGSNGREIHSKDSNGDEEWYEYDSNGNEIHEKRSDGYEEWHEYDSNGNEIHSKDSNGYEGWTEYDSNGHKIHFKDSNGDDEWYEYENVTDSDYGYDMFVYDSNGRLTFSGYTLDSWGVFYARTRYIYGDTGNLVQSYTDLAENCAYEKKIDYWSNGLIKKVIVLKGMNSIISFLIKRVRFP